MLTPANVHDTNPLKMRGFINKRYGKLFGDKGYCCFKRPCPHAYRVSPISRYYFNSKVDEGTFVKETSDGIS